MTQEEQLAFCKKCTNRKFDPDRGIVCKLTDQKPDFQDNCPDFNRDEYVKEQSHVPQTEVANHELAQHLSEDSISKFKEHQDFGYAIIGGLLISVFSALLWAVITVTTEYQIGFMAIGVGLLVGFGVRFFGAGVDSKFGILGAVLALIGCLLGNFFTQIGFLANTEGISYLQAIQLFEYSYLPEMYIETFSLIDLVFYGIAIGEGYKFAFRKITPEDLINLENPDFNAEPPLYNLRRPAAIASFLVFGLLIFVFSQGADGTVTFHYDDGSKMSQGAYSNGVEDGEWTYWYPNGQVQAVINLSEGILEGRFTAYYESGVIQTEGQFSNGMRVDLWKNHHYTGKLSDFGPFVNDREHGKWTFYYENGQQSQTGNYHRGYQDGPWVTFHENGQKASEGEFKNGEYSGIWKTWRENGRPDSEINYLENGEQEIINFWLNNGKQSVKEGNGVYTIYHDNGVPMGSGMVKNGKRDGRWTLHFANTDKMIEGYYDLGEYDLRSVWNPKGEQIVKDGNGTYEMYSTDRLTLLEKGPMVDGKRHGTWTTYYPETGNVLQTSSYNNGLLHGTQTLFFESGAKLSEGEFENDKRIGDWIFYHENGEIESVAPFVNNLKTGTQVFFNEQGTKIKEEIFKDGEFVEDRVF